MTQLIQKHPIKRWLINGERKVFLAYHHHRQWCFRGHQHDDAHLQGHHGLYQQGWSVVLQETWQLDGFNKEIHSISIGVWIFFSLSQFHQLIKSLQSDEGHSRSDYTSWQAAIGCVPKSMDMETMKPGLKARNVSSHCGWPCKRKKNINLNGKSSLNKQAWHSKHPNYKIIPLKSFPVSSRILLNSGCKITCVSRVTLWKGI